MAQTNFTNSVEVAWSDLKTFINAKKLDYSKILDKTDSYIVWVSDGAVTIWSYLTDSSDQTDYDNNYAANENKPAGINIRDFKGHGLIVRRSGEALIHSPLEQIPPFNATKVVEEYQSSVSNSDDDTYTITNGKTLFISNFISSSKLSANGTSSELFHDPNGNGSGMNRIITHTNAGNTFKSDIGMSFVGDGTAKIRVRRKILGILENALIFAKWTGWEE